MIGKLKVTTKYNINYKKYSSNIKRLGDIMNSIVIASGERIIVNEDNGYEIFILYLIRLMRSIIYSDILPYPINRPRTYKEGDDLYFLRIHIENLDRYAHLFLVGMVYPPDLEFFFDHLYRYFTRIKLGPDIFNSIIIGANNNLKKRIANSFIRSLRRGIKKNENIKQKISDWKRTTIENYKRIKEYIPTLFDKYPRLMVIRLEINYRKVAIEINDINKVSEEEVNNILRISEILRPVSRINEKSMNYKNISELKIPEPIDICEAKKDRRDFFAKRHGRPALFKHLVGHVWGIKYYHIGGYFLDFVLFFDGSQIKEGNEIYHGDNIARYIEQNLTKGRAIVYNYSYHGKDHRDSKGIGMIEHSDTLKRKNLMRELDSLVNDSQPIYVKPKVYVKGTRMFGTGHLSKKK